MGSNYEKKSQKRAPRPKIKILKSGTGFRSPRGPTFQISWSYDLKPRRSEWTNKHTDKQTNKQTDNAIYIVDKFVPGHYLTDQMVSGDIIKSKILVSGITHPPMCARCYVQGQYSEGWKVLKLRTYNCKIRSVMRQTPWPLNWQTISKCTRFFGQTPGTLELRQGSLSWTSLTPV